jgi:hypothetical protein
MKASDPNLQGQAIDASLFNPRFGAGCELLVTFALRRVLLQLSVISQLQSCCRGKTLRTSGSVGAYLVESSVFASCARA